MLVNGSTGHDVKKNNTQERHKNIYTKIFRTQAVEWEDCLNWYHKNCGGILDEDYKVISKKVWLCKLCIERRECELTMTGVKFFLRFVDNTVRTVEGDPNVVLHAANKLHPNLQLTLETPNEKDALGINYYI